MEVNMEDTFELALQFTLKWEGGYVHHPRDPGGPTNMGITQRTYNEYLDERKLPRRSVAELTKEEAKQIYYERFWKFVAFVTKPEWRLFRIAAFDTAVNFGPANMTWLWQKALGIKADGGWGPITAGTTATRIKWQGDLRAAVSLVCERIRYRGHVVYKDCTRKDFLNGWLNRDTDLVDYLLKLGCSLSNPQKDDRNSTS
jgi:lysozyme family protein